MSFLYQTFTSHRSSMKSSHQCPAEISHFQNVYFFKNCEKLVDFCIDTHIFFTFYHSSSMVWVVKRFLHMAPMHFLTFYNASAHPILPFNTWETVSAANHSNRPGHQPYVLFDKLECVFFLTIPRGSAELLEESGGNPSPSESMSSIPPSCMPFSWFGDRDRDKEPSSSNSSLPYAATETSSEQSQDRKNKVRTLSVYAHV